MSLNRTPPPAAYPPMAYSVFVIGALMAATILSQLDRSLPSMLVGPIREAFSISDTQMSLFQGAAFAVFYALFGLVFGQLVDRSNRRNLIIFGLLGWSVMTVFAGFAETFWQLLIARVGVGVGEAVLAPAAYSLIADYVEPRRRGRALAIYMTAITTGGGISLLTGGLVVRAIGKASMIHLPVLGDFAPWQLVFVIVGLPGFLVALLLLTVREPPRQEDGSIRAKTAGEPGEFLRYVATYRAAFTYLITAQVMVAFIAQVVAPWLPAFFSRRYGIPFSSSGMVMGPMMIFCSLGGFFLSGWLSDRWAAAGVPGARLRPMYISWAIQIPMLIAFPLVGNAVASYVCLGLLIAGTSVSLATTPTTWQDIVPNRMRGQAVALSLLVSGLVGWGLGPTATALFTDYVFGYDAALPYSIVAAGVPAGLIGIFAVWRGMAPFIAAHRSLVGQEPGPPPSAALAVAPG